MALELGGRILLQFPVRYAAHTANVFKPFIAEPAGGPAVSGIVDDEGFIAVRGNFSPVPNFVNGLDAMQYTLAGRPQFDFINQPKKLDPFAIKPFSRFLNFFSAGHSEYIALYHGHPISSGVMEYWNTGVLVFLPSLHNSNTPRLPMRRNGCSIDI
jgi:hypothetical protein